MYKIASVGRGDRCLGSTEGSESGPAIVLNRRQVRIAGGPILDLTRPIRCRQGSQFWNPCLLWRAGFEAF